MMVNIEVKQEIANVSGESTQRAAARLRTHSSSLIAKILEYQLLGAIGAELLSRGQTLEILRGDIDADGHDVIVEANGIIRHIQLKSKVAGGTTDKVTCHTALASKPSGCVLWITYDPGTYLAVEFGCFGGEAGERLPDLGTKVALRSTHNKEKERPPRRNHRELKLKRFEQRKVVSDLVDWLFGPPPSREQTILIEHMRAGPQPEPHLPIWVAKVREGRFEYIPAGLTFDDSLYLAHLINGYDVAAELGIEDPFAFAETQLATAMETGRWEGDCVTLWVSLFLEHRRWRQASPHEPCTEMRVVLDQLARQLAGSLNTTNERWDVN